MEALSPKIIFFGTPEFSRRTLEALLKTGFQIQAVVTQPDTISPKGILQTSEVKVFAQKNQIPVFAPEKMKGNSEFEEVMKQYMPDLFVVVVYGKIIPKNILEIPTHGAINIHPSLLPKYRGPSPYQTALLEGAKETGITIMLMDELMDHGPILSQERVPITLKDSFETLHDKLCDMGTHLLIKTIPRFLSGEITPQEQNHDEATFTKFFHRDDGKIDWSKRTDEIERMVRALNPWPGTWTLFQEKRLKILRASIVGACHGMPLQQSGTFFVQRGALFVQTGDGSLEILKLQLEGKKAQSAEEFIHGYNRLISGKLEQ